jgi:hypothetical protein
MLKDRYRNRAYGDHLASLSAVTRSPLGLPKRRALADPSPGAAVRSGGTEALVLADPVDVRAQSGQICAPRPMIAEKSSPAQADIARQALRSANYGA